MKELRESIIRLFDQGKTGYQIPKDMNIGERRHIEQSRDIKKLEVLKTNQEAEGQKLLAYQLTSKKSRVESSEIRTVERILHAKWLRQSGLEEARFNEFCMKARKMKKAHRLTEKGKKKQRLIRCKRLKKRFAGGKHR